MMRFGDGILVGHQQVVFPIDIHRCCVLSQSMIATSPFDVAEITRHKSGQGGLARATFLGEGGMGVSLIIGWD